MVRGFGPLLQSYLGVVFQSLSMMVLFFVRSNSQSYTRLLQFYIADPWRLIQNRITLIFYESMQLFTNTSLRPLPKVEPCFNRSMASTEYSKGLGPFLVFLKKSNLEPQPKEVDLGFCIELDQKKSMVYLFQIWSYLDLMSGNRSDLGKEYLSLMLVLKYEFSKIQSMLIKLLSPGIYFYSTYISHLKQYSHPLRPPNIGFCFPLTLAPAYLQLIQVRMQIQAVNRQQLELKHLIEQNERIHHKKSEHLLAKLEAAKINQCDVDFLQNIHLPYTLAFLQQIVAAKKLQVGAAVSQEESIEKQVLTEYSAENKLILQQIQQIQAEIEKIKGRKHQLVLAQRHTSSQISQLEERLFKKRLDLRKQDSFYFKKRMSPCLSFGYDKQSNGRFEFKSSYQSIVNHFVKRIEENQEIINKLENSVKDRVKQSQTIKAKINKCRSLKAYCQNTNDNVERLKKQCESSKVQIQQRVEATNQEVNRLLPGEIDRKIKDIRGTKGSYERAYHALVEIVSQVVEHADLSRVTDYINQS